MKCKECGQELKEEPVMYDQIFDAIAEFIENTGKEPNRIYLGERQILSMSKILIDSPKDDLKAYYVFGLRLYQVKDYDHLTVVYIPKLK